MDGDCIRACIGINSLLSDLQPGSHASISDRPPLEPKKIDDPRAAVYRCIQIKGFLGGG